MTNKFLATFRYRNDETGRSICAAVLESDPDNIRYGFDLLPRDQIILSEDEFFDSVLSKLEHSVPFAVKSKSFLMNRTVSLLSGV